MFNVGDILTFENGKEFKIQGFKDNKANVVFADGQERDINILFLASTKEAKKEKTLSDFFKKELEEKLTKLFSKIKKNNIIEIRVGSCYAYENGKEKEVEHTEETYEILEIALIFIDIEKEFLEGLIQDNEGRWIVEYSKEDGSKLYYKGILDS